MRRAALLAALAVLALAAPLGAGTTAVLWPDGAGHAHSDPAQHQGVGFGMTFLGHANLGTAIGEVDVKTDPDTGKVWVAVALLNGGFALVDGSDPADPVVVATVDGGAAYGADVKMADDTDTVYLVLQGGGAPCNLGRAPVMAGVPWKLPCGVQVWDTSDKANPLFLLTLPTSSGGSHMMDYEVFDGVPTIAMAAQGSPAGVPIALVPGNKAPVTVGRAEAGFNHDVTLRKDPLDAARNLAIVANWGNGVRVYDVTNPLQPAELGHWQPPAGSGGNIHTVMPMALDGKRIIVAEQELYTSSIVSKVFFLDATDFGDMRLLGTWANPDGKTAQGNGRFSTHNFNLEDGKLYMGHYHGGVVVLDVSSLDRLADPPMVANYLPDRPRVSARFATDVPFTWDAFPHEGVVWASDINTGLYALRLA